MHEQRNRSGSPRVGVQLPEVEREVPWQEYLAMARAAEEVGFDSIWVGDHLLYRGDGEPERGPWEAWTVLAALAAATERVELGPLVACAAFHPPGLIAKMAAAIAAVSGGRFVLGLGAGWNEEEFRAFGLPFDHRVSRFEEAFTIIRGLLAGERVTLRGRFHQAEDAVLLPRPAAPPRLMIGSNGPRMLAGTLPHVTAWNTWYEDYGNSPERFGELNERISAAARDAGRDPGDIERSACALVGIGAASGERASTPEGSPPVTGSPNRIASVLGELHEAGANEIILVVDPIEERSIRELGEVVELLRNR
jgi:alkanesulfonate monooxygenase SsuD/methylene tetrahydromethanopterin reductase-like flavin-dependent oxidoreductase (luciferase family)